MLAFVLFFQIFFVKTSISCFPFQGPDAAKTLLFQSCQQRPPSLQGVLALCVLGLQQSNPTLVQAALSEMDKHKDNSKADIIAMKSLVMALQGLKTFTDMGSLIGNTQCGNFRIFLPLRFYVKCHIYHLSSSEF